MLVVCHTYSLTEHVAIKNLKNMDEMLYEDKLSGEISSDNYLQKHRSFIDEIKGIEEN